MWIRWIRIRIPIRIRNTAHGTVRLTYLAQTRKNTPDKTKFEGRMFLRQLFPLLTFCIICIINKNTLANHHSIKLKGTKS
jgi:hypothetical protein